jgi:hypothetical protein
MHKGLLTAYFGFLTAQESKGTSPIFAFYRSTIGQNAHVLVNRLNDHPEHLHEDSGVLTLRAFQDAYSCKAKDSDAKKAINNN